MNFRALYDDDECLVDTFIFMNYHETVYVHAESGVVGGIHRESIPWYESYISLTTQQNSPINF